MYEPRTYRDGLEKDRFRTFTVVHKETDLWIAVGRESYTEDMVPYAVGRAEYYREQLEGYIRSYPEFGASFTPVSAAREAPLAAVIMAEAGKKAGTGPMAAVAGTFSELIGKDIIDRFAVKEIIIENGGDIFLSVKRKTVISVHAGTSPLSGKIGIEIPPGTANLGICTSSGTVGHSFSYGKADAAVVVAENTATADAFATAYGNTINESGDIRPALEHAKANPDIAGALFIKDMTAGAAGKIKLACIK